MIVTDRRSIPAPPPILVQILADFTERGITVTPLGVISRATDLGATDAEIDRIVDQLAGARGLEDAA